MNALRKPRYKVDLINLQAVCEANYWRLLRLMPDMADSDRLEVLVEDQDGEPQSLVIEVLERCRYTTTVRLIHQREHEWLTPPSMELRLYHDAGMAEVVAAYNRRRFRGVYPYPNEQMLQPDERSEEHTSELQSPA